MRLRILVPLMVALLALAACDGDDNDVAEADGVGDDGVITLEMYDMYYEPDAVTVPAGENVTFELVNEGGSEHDLTFDDGRQSEMVQPGETVMFEAGAFEEDTVGWCTVPGHREAGMELEVTVE